MGSWCVLCVIWVAVCDVLYFREVSMGPRVKLSIEGDVWGGNHGRVVDFGCVGREK